MVDRALADHRVEAAGREGQRVGPAPHPDRERRRRPRAASSLASPDIRAEGSAPTTKPRWRRERARVLAEAARDVEDAPPRARRGQAQRALGHAREQELAVARGAGRNHVAHVPIEIDDAHLRATLAESRSGRAASRRPSQAREAVYALSAMAEASAPEGKSLPRSVVQAGAATLDRLASFRLIYVAIFVFALLYIASVQGAQALLQSHFRRAVEQAVRVSPADGPVVEQIQRRVDAARARLALGADRPRARECVRAGRRRADPALRARAPGPAAPRLRARRSLRRGARRCCPPAPPSTSAVPHDSVLATSILVLYGAVLIAVLFSYNRRVARREAELVEAAVADRDATAQRAASIETELEQVRKRLADVEPAEHAQAEEIRELAREREALQAQARRAREPGDGAARARPRASSSSRTSGARSRICSARRSRTSARRRA